jgi:hypothetical protein
MRPFIIDDKLKTQIASLVAYAEKNPVSMDELLDTVNKQAKPVGDFSQHTLNLPFGYRIVYSIEEQPKGKIRHLSMSVNEDEKLPNEFVVREVMKLIGFKNELENCMVKLENISPKRQAVNVLEIIEADK